MISDCDDDGLENDVDCNDRDASIGVTGSTGQLPSCLVSSCLSILEEGHSIGSGNYWFDDGTGNPMEVYCDMDIEGGGWLLFGILESPSSHLTGSQPFGSVVSGSLNSTWIFFGYRSVGHI